MSLPPSYLGTLKYTSYQAYTDGLNVLFLNAVFLGGAHARLA